ncbi:MAG: sulfur carrier protein ThiS [Betaproteobacteria bacterium]
MNPDLLLTVNGTAQRLPVGTTVGALLQTMELAGKRVAVEVNDSIVPRSQHASTWLANGDRVEIVIAVGGG